MERKVEAVGDPDIGKGTLGGSDFEAFKAGCTGIPLDQVRRDWRREQAKMKLSRRIWDQSRGDNKFPLYMLGQL